jgi:K+-transporting ATPase KdpF subunit
MTFKTLSAGIRRAARGADMLRVLTGHVSKYWRIRNWSDGYGRNFARIRNSLLRHFVCLRQSVRQSLVGSEPDMLVEYILGGGVTVFLLAYLTYALVRPERF